VNAPNVGTDELGDSPAAVQARWLLGLAVGDHDLDDAEWELHMSERFRRAVTLEQFRGVLEQHRATFTAGEVVDVTHHGDVGVLVAVESPDARLQMRCVVGRRTGTITSVMVAPTSAEVASLGEVPALLERDGGAAVSAAFGRRGELVWEQAWGSAGPGRPAEPATLFQAGSVSKPIAVFAALRLVAQGRIGLDDDIADHLRSWSLPEVEGWSPRLSLRDLASHCAGLSVWGFPGYPRGGPVATLADVLAGAPPANTPPIVPEALPGLTWRYSGGGYSVLQQVLVDVAGLPFDVLVCQEVLEPLGMTSSTMEQPLPEDRAGSEAEGWSGSGPGTLEVGWHVYPEMAAAGLWTTAADLVRFAMGVDACRAGARPDVLPAVLAEEMVSPQPIHSSMGLGLFLGGAPARTVGHGGANAGFTSDLVWTLDGDLYAAVVSSANGTVPRAVTGLIFDQELGEKLPASSSISVDAVVGMSAAEPETPAPDDNLDDAWQAVAGVYRSGARDLEIVGDGARLSLLLPGQRPVRLVPADGIGLVVRGLGVDLSFPDTSTMLLTQLGQRIEFTRIPS